MTNNTIVIETINSKRSISARVTWQPAKITAPKFEIFSHKASNGFDTVSGVGVFLGDMTFGIPGGLVPWVPSNWATRNFACEKFRDEFVDAMSIGISEFAHANKLQLIIINR